MRFVCFVLLVIPLIARAASAQWVEPYPPDQQAVKAFARLIETYRTKPAIKVKETLKLVVGQGDLNSKPAESRVTLTSVRAADGTSAGLAEINEFTVQFSGGTLHALHARNGDFYYETEYEGAPYWALLDCFRDLPWPMLAILWGEPEMEGTWQELHWKTPFIVPTGTGEETIEEKRYTVIRLTAPDGSLVLRLDPQTGFVASARHEITSGQWVEDGAAIVTEYRYETQVLDGAPAEALSFAPGTRQRADSLVAMTPRPVRPEQHDLPPGAAPAPEGALIGKPAPLFLLSTLAGDAIDLEDYRDKVVILDFWASWCGPCRQALAKLNDLQRWIDQEQLPAIVITCNTAEGRGPDADTPDARLAAARKVAEELNLSLPIAMDYSDETAHEWGVTAFPTLFVIVPGGTVHAVYRGFSEEHAAKIRDEIRDALGAGAPPR